MKRLRTTRFTFLALLTLLSSAAAEVGPGDLAPDFTLADAAGAPYTLSDLRGKVVLLDLIGYACQPCVTSAPGVEAIWQDFKDTGVFEVLALDMWNGTVSLVQSFIDETSVTYPVLRNAGFLQSEAFYGITFDNFVVVDSDGIVRYTSVNEPFDSFNDTALRATIVQHLPVAVESKSWSAMKNLYSRGTAK